MGRAISTTLICLAFVVISSFSCSTTEKKSENPKSYYTLRLGDTKDHGSPLPAETRILIDWYSDSGRVTTVDGFVGYDFDRDGRFEMIEVLGANGEPKSYVYDFDGNGKIDKIAGDSDNEIDPKTVFAKARELLSDPMYAH